MRCLNHLSRTRVEHWSENEMQIDQQELDVKRLIDFLLVRVNNIKAYICTSKVDIGERPQNLT